MERKRNNVIELTIASIKITEEPFKDNEPQLFEKLKNSIYLRGQLRNIVVCENGDDILCLEGSKILKAMKELGEEKVLCVNVGELSEEEQSIFRLELFKDYFFVDYVQVAKTLKKLCESKTKESLCSTIPFDFRQVENLIKLLDFDWNEFNDNKSKISASQINIFDMIQDDSMESQLCTDAGNQSLETAASSQKSESNVINIVNVAPHDPAINHPECEVEYIDLNALDKILTSELADTVSIKSDEGKQNSLDELDLLFESKSSTLTIESLIENNPLIVTSDMIEVGATYTLKGRKDREIEVTNVTEKWVIFNDLSDGGKRKDCKIDQFLKNVVYNTIKAIQTNIQPTLDKSKSAFEQAIEEVSQQNNHTKLCANESNPPTDDVFSSDIPTAKEFKPSNRLSTEIINGMEVQIDIPSFRESKTGLSIKNVTKPEIKKLEEELQEDIDNGFIDEQLKHEVIESVKSEVIKEENIKKEHSLNDISRTIELTPKPQNDIDLSQIRQNENFFMSDKRCLIITDLHDAVMSHIPFVVSQILSKKWHQTKIVSDHIKIISKTHETSDVEVHHIIYVNDYGVRYNIVLEEVYDMLSEIDLLEEDEILD